MKIIQRKSPNHWSYSNKKTAIILHKGLGTMIGDMAWINNPVSQVSYHYYFPRKGDTVYQLVANKHSSWSAGHVKYKPTELGETILQKDRSGKREYLNANLYVYNFGFQGKEKDTYTNSQMELASWVEKQLGGDLIIATHHDLVLYKPLMDEYAAELIRKRVVPTEHTPTKSKRIRELLILLILRLLKGRKAIR